MIYRIEFNEVVYYQKWYDFLILKAEYRSFSIVFFGKPFIILLKPKNSYGYKTECFSLRLDLEFPDFIETEIVFF